jgi:hypothetical protein
MPSEQRIRCLWQHRGYLESGSKAGKKHISGAKQAAEKGPNSTEIPEKHTAGAKARIDSAAFVPGINPRLTSRASFSAACKARVDFVDLIPGINPCPSARTSFSATCEALFSSPRKKQDSDCAAS